MGRLIGMLMDAVDYKYGWLDNQSETAAAILQVVFLTPFFVFLILFVQVCKKTVPKGSLRREQSVSILLVTPHPHQQGGVLRWF